MERKSYCPRGRITLITKGATGLNYEQYKSPYNPLGITKDGEVDETAQQGIFRTNSILHPPGLTASISSSVSQIAKKTSNGTHII